MKRIQQLAWFNICVALLVCTSAIPSSLAQLEEVVDTKEKRDIVLYQGDILALRVYSLTRIAISKPNVVEIVNADVDEILLSGKTIGQTQIFIWDEYGKRSLLARVMEEDMSMVKERIEQLLDSAEIDGVELKNSAYEGKLIATGKVNKVQKEAFDKVVEEFGGFIINMVEEQGDLIQIDAQITELSTTLNKELGVSWSQPPITLTEDAAPGPEKHGFSDVFRVGDFTRTSIITATINALLATSRARDLARPSIVVSDGEEASIVVGGEVPITTSTATDVSTTTNVSYKSYGVQLSVTPEIKDDDKIDIRVDVSISNQDSTFGGEGSAFTTTTANTRVLLDDGQTIIIAGLIQLGEEESETKVPFLNRIPILGQFLFTYKTYNKTPDKEVVISITPYLRRQKNKLKTNQEIKQGKEVQEKGEAETKNMNMEKAGAALLEEDSDMDNIESSDAAKEIKEIEKKEEDLDKLLASIEEAVKISGESSGDDGVSNIITGYVKDVQKKIASRISFPLQAKEEGWQGIVTLSLTILSDGTLSDSTIKESSGYSVFDQDALNTAAIVAPFKPFPVELGMDEIAIDIPVSYSQKDF